MRKSGFTLIEILVMVGVFLAVSAVIAGILFSVLRGSTKTTTIDQVRQNGDFAISRMSKTIRSAQSLTNCSTSSVVIINSDNTTTTFSCGADTISENGTPILNTGASGTVALVSGSCSFSCSADTPPTVTIKFSLSQAGSTSFVESKSIVGFETSVTLRNP